MTLVSTAAKSGGNTSAQVAASGKVVPVANTTGVTVDTTTYDDPISGSGKLTTLVFPDNRGGVAIAVTGDAFPRVLLASEPNDGWYLGDGVADPSSSTAALSVARNANNTYRASLGGRFTAHGRDTNHGDINQSVSALQLTGGAFLMSGTGAPAIGGNVGDIYVRVDGGVLTTLYQCSVAGTAGNATWAGIL